MTKEGDRALRETIIAYREIAGGKINLIGENNIVAENILKEDLGFYGEPTQEYDFSGAVRDRLIAHGRQDSANTLLNSIEILKEIGKLKKLIVMETTICAAIFVCIVFKLFL